MSTEHLLPNNTPGTAGHYEKTSGDSRHSLVLLNKQPIKCLWVMLQLLVRLRMAREEPNERITFLQPLLSSSNHEYYNYPIFKPKVQTAIVIPLYI